MLDDIDVGFSSCFQNLHLQNGINVPDWLSEGGQSFLRFTFQLKGAGGILRVARVFLESTLDV